MTGQKSLVSEPEPAKPSGTHWILSTMISSLNPFSGTNEYIQDSIFSHLKQHWVFSDEKQITILKENYFRGWQSGEHLTKFSIRLDKEQLQLNSDGIVISDAETKYPLNEPNLGL